TSAEEGLVDAIAGVAGEHPDGDGAQRIEVAAGDELPSLGEVGHAARRNLRQLLHRLAEHPGVTGAKVPAEPTLQLEAHKAHAAILRARSTARASSSKPAPSGARVT